MWGEKWENENRKENKIVCISDHGNMVCASEPTRFMSMSGQTKQKLNGSMHSSGKQYVFN